MLILLVSSLFLAFYELKKRKYNKVIRLKKVALEKVGGGDFFPKENVYTVVGT